MYCTGSSLYAIDYQQVPGRSLALVSEADISVLLLTNALPSSRMSPQPLHGYLKSELALDFRHVHQDVATHMTSSWSLGDSGYASGLSMMNAELMPSRDVDAIAKNAEEATVGTTASA